MIQARYHYTHQHDMSLKCADVFLTREAFDSWYAANHHQIKNLTTIPNIKGL